MSCIHFKIKKLYEFIFINFVADIHRNIPKKILLRKFLNKIEELRLLCNTLEILNTGCVQFYYNILWNVLPYLISKNRA